MNVVKIIFHKCRVLIGSLLSKKLAYKFTKKSVKMSFFDSFVLFSLTCNFKTPFWTKTSNRH
ncbi:hypothetical protein T03_8321 [Trichinella britovi]|uniref:Uncharacterized protein n=1 Tax=Trichinella britovi TaxID=45882 RepID=A0A0V1CEW7_TRIBR|nr:hypothetical protein T03_8321 [Trichinella britovi]